MKIKKDAKCLVKISRTQQVFNQSHPFNIAAIISRQYNLPIGCSSTVIESRLSRTNKLTTLARRLDL